MNTPRIAPLSPPYDPAVADNLAAMMPSGVPPILLFRTFAKNPRVLERIKNGNLLDKGSLTLREREIAIDRTTALCRSEYEWGVHITFFAEKAKLTREQIVSLTHGNASDDALWTASEQAIIRLCDELHQTAQVSDALWIALSQHFTEAQLIELVTVIGFYHTISFVTNAFKIDVEAFGARFADYQ